MKLLGVFNNKWFLASIHHYDYREKDGLMVDGGVIGLQSYSGYGRSRGQKCWAEVKQNFAELYTDYHFNSRRKRKYGIWPLSEVKILEEKDYPDIKSKERVAENAVWLPANSREYFLMKDLTTEHLEGILKYCEDRNKDFVIPFVKAVLETRKIG